ncbi:MAG: amidohydrolase family protein [Clostridium sp.]|nr:amidohydrolase family protein [Clostridium sp.]
MFEYNVKELGIVKAYAKYMSEFYGCACDLDVILEERNRRSMEDMKAYTKSLYEDMNFIGETLDAPHPMGAEETKCFPVKYLCRLFQTDPLFYRLVKECETYDELISKFDAGIRYAIVDEGFKGIKAHILERNAQRPHYVTKEQAEGYFKDAKSGNVLALEEIYFAAFTHMLIMTQEMHFPVHIHAGTTGKDCFMPEENYDPFRLVPYLCDRRIKNAWLVLLHCGFPHVRTAATVAQNFPNVWVNVAQVLPWDVINFPNILEQLMSFASHGKIMMGTGAHIHPEINWLGAKIAKESVAIVLDRAVRRGFMTREQGQKTGELMLYKNALRMYGFDEP